MLPVLDVQLLVREEDKEKASRILDEYLEANLQEADEGADPAEA